MQFRADVHIFLDHKTMTLLAELAKAEARSRNEFMKDAIMFYALQRHPGIHDKVFGAPKPLEPMEQQPRSPIRLLETPNLEPEPVQVTTAELMKLAGHNIK